MSEIPSDPEDQLFLNNEARSPKTFQVGILAGRYMFEANQGSSTMEGYHLERPVFLQNVWQWNALARPAKKRQEESGVTSSPEHSEFAELPVIATKLTQFCSKP